MSAGGCQRNPALLSLLIVNLCFYGAYNSSELQVCELCSGTVPTASAVAEFCVKSLGQIQGRCCVRNGTRTDDKTIIGLDLSNCSLTQVGSLQEASAASIIDLSQNPLSNLSDETFQGFTELNYLMLPVTLPCPGGATSWKIIETREGNRICEGQNSACNQTSQLLMGCPENSQCAPYGPGLFECSCVDNFHGYKCLREGEFPALQVFGPLGASTVAFSVLLWVTQRRMAKPL